MPILYFLEALVSFARDLRNLDLGFIRTYGLGLIQDGTTFVSPLETERGEDSLHPCSLQYSRRYGCGVPEAVRGFKSPVFD